MTGNYTESVGDDSYSLNDITFGVPQHIVIPAIISVVWLVALAASCLEMSFLEQQTPKGYAVLSLFLLFGLGIGLQVRREKRGNTSLDGLASLLAQALAIVGLALLTTRGSSLVLLTLLAAQLPMVLAPRRAVAVLLVVQVVVTSIALSRFGPENVLGIVAHFGFQYFALFTMILALSERKTRISLSRTANELGTARLLLTHTAKQNERLRIARDIHDTVGHHLAALNLRLELATNLSGEELTNEIRAARALSHVLATDVRETVMNYRDLEKFDLRELLNHLGKNIPGVSINCEGLDTVRIVDPRVAESAYRSIQEATTNAVLHGTAKNVYITAYQDKERIRVTVRDDGTGCANITPGNGLKGMRERAEQVGGSVRCGSTPGGFIIELDWPV